jgi:hypothetical protein
MEILAMNLAFLPVLIKLALEAKEIHMCDLAWSILIGRIGQSL